MSRYAKCVILVCVCCLMAAGCATNEAARNVARVTLTQVATYEEQLDKKIQAEQTFYRETSRIFEDALKRDAFSREISLYLAESQDFERALSSSSSRLTESELRDAVLRAISRAVEAEAETEARRTELKAELLSSLEKLEREKKGLQKVRKGLTDLQTAPSDREQLDALIAFVKATKEKYDELAKKAADAGAQ